MLHATGIGAFGPDLLGALIGGGLRVAAVLLVLTALVALLRRATAATRHAAWRTGFVIALLLPIAAPALPWRLPVLPVLPAVPTTPTERALPQLAATGSGVDEARGARGGEEAARTAGASRAGGSGSGNAAALGAGAAAAGGAPHSPQPTGEGAAAPASGSSGAALPSLPLLLLAGWLLGAALIGARLVAGQLAVWRILRTGRRLDGPDWTSPLRQAADLLDVGLDVDLVESDRVAMPFTAGVRRPAIVMPAAARGWDLERRRTVLMHELAHVRRRDLLAHLIARWVCVLHWFNPLVWLGARRMRAESELAADDLVLSAGARPSDYAEHLLQIVSGAGRAPVPAAALPLARRRELEGRVLAILDPVARRAPARWRTVATTALVLLVCLPFAALDPAGAGAQPRPEEGRHAPPEWARDDGGSDVRKDVQARVGRGPAGPAHDPVDLHAEVEAEVEAELDADADADAEVEEERRSFPAAVLRQDVRVELKREESVRLQERVRALVTALADPAPEVRCAAIGALSELRDPPTVQVLLRLLRDDPVPEVRAAAADALGDIEDRTAVPGLIRAVEEQGPGVRERAVHALGRMEDARAIPVLTRVALEERGAMRLQAVSALAGVESPESVPALLRTLQADELEVRVRSAHALGDIESPRAVAGLAQALRSSDARLREAAAEALGDIQSAEAVPALIRAVEDEAEPVRLAAIHALSDIESPEAAPVLVRAMDTSSRQVLLAAAGALARLDLPRAPAGLVERLSDPSPQVRSAVAEALGDIEDPATVPALRAALADENPEVRMAVTEALLDMEPEVVTDLPDHEDPRVRRMGARTPGNG